MVRRVFITVAEVSGDQHAGHLAEHLRELDPHLHIEGHGGPDMAEAGVVVHHETTKRAAMAYQAAARAGEMWKLFRWTKKYFDEHKPDLQICVDSPAMNFPHLLEVAKLIREAYPKVSFIVPTTPATTPVVARLAEEFNRLMEEARSPLPTATIGAEYNGGALLRYGERLFDQLVPHCDLCLTVSGTATLHVAGYGVPMIVVYR